MSAGLARNNPFRSERVEQLRFRLDEPGWRELMDRFERLGYRGALVGPKGSGKTTLLEEIEARLEARGWSVRRWRLTSDRRVPTQQEWRLVETSGPRDLVSVDGVEQLSWGRKRRFLKASGKAGALLVTSHLRGLLPTLREHRTSFDLLEDLVAELVGRVEAERWRPLLRDLFDRYRGNVRECLRSLYDCWPEA